MSYTIYYSDPAKISYPITVLDNTLFNGVGTGGLTLVGKNYPGYGQPVADNFIHLLENFSSSIPPINPVEGQLWYDNFSKKLRFNNGTANNSNWKPINGIYQQDTQPFDADIGDIWVDTLLNQVKLYSNASQWIIISTVTSNLNGAIYETILDNTSQSRDIIKFYINGNEQAILTDAAFTPQSPPYGFTTFQSGINLKSNSLLNGIADSANYIRQSGIKVSGTVLVRNDIAQRLNGQIVIGQDGNALSIGVDPTFILEKTINGSNANFVNTYPNYGTFAFNIKDPQSKNIPILTIGGNPQQVIIQSYQNASNSSNGALVVNGGIGIGADVYIGGNLYFTGTSSNLSISGTTINGLIPSTSTQTGSLIVKGGVGISGNVNLGGNIGISGVIYDSYNSSGNNGNVLISYGNKIKWQSILAGTHTGYNVPYNTEATVDNLKARVTTGGVPQLSASTSTMNAYWSAHQIIYGISTSSNIVNNGISLSTSSWTSVGVANTLTNGGDTIIAHVQDRDRGNFYRVTYIQTAGSNSASALIDKLI